MEVIDDALVASPQKAPHHVGSHSAKSDHAQFHVAFLSFESGSVRSTQMSDATAESQDFQNLYFACSAFPRVADEASSQNTRDQFPGFCNYLIRNEEPALALFSIDRTPWCIVMDSTLARSF